MVWAGTWPTEYYDIMMIRIIKLNVNFFVIAI